MKTSRFLSTSVKIYEEFKHVYLKKGGAEKDAKRVYYYAIETLQKYTSYRRWVEDKLEERGKVNATDLISLVVAATKEDSVDLSPFNSWGKLYIALENNQNSNKLKLHDILKDSPAELLSRFK